MLFAELSGGTGLLFTLLMALGVLAVLGNLGKAAKSDRAKSVGKQIGMSLLERLFRK